MRRPREPLDYLALLIVACFVISVLAVAALVLFLGFPPAGEPQP